MRAKQIRPRFYADAVDGAVNAASAKGSTLDISFKAGRVAKVTGIFPSLRRVTSPRRVWWHASTWNLPRSRPLHTKDARQTGSASNFSSQRLGTNKLMDNCHGKGHLPQTG
jgi:hypothetical protein